MRSVLFWLFLAIIMYVLLRVFFATTRKHVRREKLSHNEERHRIVCQNEVYRDNKRYLGIPPWFRCAHNN